MFSGCLANRDFAKLIYKRLSYPASKAPLSPFPASHVQRYPTKYYPIEHTSIRIASSHLPTMGLFFTSKYENAQKLKQKQREDTINALPEYHKSLTSKEKDILNYDVPELAKLVKANELKPKEILLAYGKQSLIAHAKTNCLTEVMLKDAEEWAEKVDTSGPLAGIPVSLKDQIFVKGYDATVGYSKLAFNPCKEDGGIAKLLRGAGAVPYVKTNVPITMMAIEGYNDLFGRTTNWHNPNYAPGGSSQGEGALIASGGSRIGIGSDIGGSVRVPAAWSGVCSLKLSTFRWPIDGNVSGAGFEGVPATTSPMARTLPDLRYFVESVMKLDPWKSDYRLLPIPWREEKLPSKPKVGVLTFPRFLPPTPAQQRALDTTVNALKNQGCEIVEFTLPSPEEEYDNLVHRLYYADGYQRFCMKLYPGEHNDPFVASCAKYIALPKFVRKIWQGILRLFGYSQRADALANEHSSSTLEYIEDTDKREKLRKQFSEHWDASGVDFVVCPPHASPALPNYVPESFRAILYTSLFNLLDYSAGVIPVDRVNSKLDQLPSSFDFKKLSYPGKITFETYDPVKMEGLPTAVQIVTKRYQDELALEAMDFTFDALKKAGVTYKY